MGHETDHSPKQNKNQQLNNNVLRNEEKRKRAQFCCVLSFRIKTITKPKAEAET